MSVNSVPSTQAKVKPMSSLSRHLHATPARMMAAEVSSLAKYFDSVTQVEPLEDEDFQTLDLIDNPNCSKVNRLVDLPDFRDEPSHRGLVFFRGNFNHSFDIQETLQGLHGRMNRHCRVAVLAYSPYLRWVYWLANKLGIRKAPLPSTLLTHTDLANLCKISNFELVKVRTLIYSPWSLLGVGALINRVLPAIPGLRQLSFLNLLVLRPVVPDQAPKSLSVVIPARNEMGNIENALKRMPKLGPRLEVIFVEGHSSDDTWKEILRVKEAYKDQFEIKAFQQTGKGKNDAVRVGFKEATGDLLTILDADLTMPPELLHRFYDAYTEGKADFVNGSRLLYPMEGEAMRFLNRLGNIFFAKALSWVLGTSLGDSLCGTKLVHRRDYERIVAWRNDFGDFDPFGDFELLFPASILGMGIVDIPIRYRDRTYGSTNISRFRHGFMLLKMTTIGLLRVKLGRL